MRTIRHGFIGQAWIAALASAVVLGLAVPQSSLAQGVAPPAAAPAKAKAKTPKAAAPAGEEGGEAAAAPAGKDPAVALAAYTAGVKAYQAGKFDAAVKSLDSAISNGGLTAGQMPRAMYYRGAAHQQLGKSGQAISDLTSALWFKPGLEDAERAEATKLRAAAYRDAGLDDTGQSVRAASAAPETGSVGASARTSVVPGETSPSSGLGGIGTAFGKLFGDSGSSSAPSPAPAPPPERAPVVAAAPVGGEPEILPWANRPPVAEPAVEAEAPAATAPVKPVKPKAAAKPAAPPKAGGAVKIQVASVKSRDEASAVISKLKGMGAEISSVSASVDESTFGATTYYRVRLGPYATAAATAGPCKTLKAQGLDCLVTPN